MNVSAAIAGAAESMARAASGCGGSGARGWRSVPAARIHSAAAAATPATIHQRFIRRAGTMPVAALIAGSDATPLELALGFAGSIFVSVFEAKFDDGSGLGR